MRTFESIINQYYYYYYIIISILIVVYNSNNRKRSRRIRTKKEAYFKHTNFLTRACGLELIPASCAHNAYFMAELRFTFCYISLPRIG